MTQPDPELPPMPEPLPIEEPDNPSEGTPEPTQPVAPEEPPALPPVGGGDDPGA